MFYCTHMCTSLLTPCYATESCVQSCSDAVILAPKLWMGQLQLKGGFPFFFCTSDIIQVQIPQCTSMLYACIVYGQTSLVIRSWKRFSFPQVTTRDETRGRWPCLVHSCDARCVKGRRPEPNPFLFTQVTPCLLS